jgi:hypothetical protein
MYDRRLLSCFILILALLSACSEDLPTEGNDLLPTNVTLKVNGEPKSFYAIQLDLDTASGTVSIYNRDVADTSLNMIIGYRLLDQSAPGSLPLASSLQPGGARIQMKIKNNPLLAISKSGLLQVSDHKGDSATATFAFEADLREADTIRKIVVTEGKFKLRIARN